MGRRIIALAKESGQFEIMAAVEKGGHPEVGKDIGELAGIGSIGIPLSGVYPAKADVLIDFSLPEAAETTIDYCLTHNVALVMGTTGLKDEQRTKLVDAAKKIPLLYATNMSVGMNVLFNLAAKAAVMLGDDYDIEIIEQHHRFKKDAPSGSALTLAENICKATVRRFPACIVNGRSGTDALREKGTIGIHAVRAGDITGVHSVIFGTIGETITLNHSAANRDNFVRGAIKAANWLVGKKPAMYSMADVLGLK